MEKPVNKRHQQYQATLEAIRAAVDKLMAEVGYDAMRIQDIAKEAGVAYGSFYHYFASKEDIFEDRYIRSDERLKKHFEERVKTLDPIEALKEIVHYNWEYAGSRIPEVLKNYVKSELEHYHEWTEKHPSSYQTLILSLIEQGQEKGIISKKYTADQIRCFLIDFFRGKTFTQCITNGSYLHNPANMQIVLDFLDGLRC